MTAGTDPARATAEVLHAALDALIVGGSIVDGSGAAARPGDVGIRGDRLVVLPPGSGATADLLIDASGAVVCPGVIDIHTHSDFTLLEEPTARSALRQGVTTEVIGNCGQSYAPITERNADSVTQRSRSWQPGVPVDWRSVGEYLDRVRAANGANSAFLVGHNAIRTAVVGFEERPATGDEVHAMAELVDQALDEGAIGLSFGLEYPPARAAGFEEQRALVERAAARGGLVGCHMKNRDVDFEPSLEEILSACRDTGVRLQLSHFTAKPGHPPGAWERVLARVDEERARGTDIAMDVYPFHTGPGFATAFLPEWAVAGGAAATLRRLRDPGQRERLRHDYDRYWRFVGAGEWQRLSLAYSGAHPDWIGRAFDELARELGVEPIDVLLRLFEDEGEAMNRITVNGQLFSEDYVRSCLRHRLFSIGSDGWRGIRDGGEGEVAHHPNCWALVPTVLGGYVRDGGVLTLEEAVWKLTGFPAARLGWDDRGLVRTDQRADLVVLDPHEVASASSYAQPFARPRGIREVFVNGRRAVAGGELTGEVAGRVL
jgi:N-acyl-D-aspartate/D-glutamate deacylase